MKRIRITLLVVFAFPFISIGQIELNQAFAARLEAAGMTFVTPLEAAYKAIRVRKDQVEPYHFSIFSKREKMEIRYIVEPEKANDFLAHAPHVKATRLLTQLASNEEDFPMTALSMSDQFVKENYNADWGREFFFHPKEGVSFRTTCKLIALYKEGKGMAYIMLFFDEAPDNLDARSVALQFEYEPKLLKVE